MQPGDLVKYKNGNAYLITGKREIRGKLLQSGGFEGGIILVVQGFG